MESKAKLLGHPIHPLLIPFPLGLLVTGVIFDIIYLATANTTMAVVAFWMLVAGIVGGLVAAPFGWIDWQAIQPNTRAKKIGLLHGLGNVVVLLLFIMSVWWRWQILERPDAWAYLFSFLGVGLLGLTGWLGGELVDRLGVGVDDGAHLNAPSSLSKKAG